MSKVVNSINEIKFNLKEDIVITCKGLFFNSEFDEKLNIQTITITPKGIDNCLLREDVQGFLLNSFVSRILDEVSEEVKHPGLKSWFFNSFRINWEKNFKCTRNDKFSFKNVDGQNFILTYLITDLDPSGIEVKEISFSLHFLS